MNNIQKHIFTIGLTLALFAIGATGLVVITEKTTHDRIIENERQALLKAINAIIPASDYDNDIASDTVLLAPSTVLSTSEPTLAYRARKNGQAVAIVFTTIAPDGYNGTIKLLVGVDTVGKLTGVRVISHKETPGLGDKIDVRKSEWISQFSGLSLNQPDEGNWYVRKDGGEFDQFTGATITPRATIKATKNALHYFAQHQQQLFASGETEKP
jgi:electron transport complex protein RnfG